MKLKCQNLIILVLAISLFCKATCEVVCSEDELVKEIVEDLADNGKLDCLRESLPRDEKESPEQKGLRIAANWDSDCSFEAGGESK